MNPGFLSSYFTGVAAKLLTNVEADRAVSNQHEWNGVTALREILGSERRSFPTHLIYLSDDDAATIEADATLMWYDARERQTHRAAEWRLYYPTTTVAELARPGDLFVLGRRPDDTLLVIVAAAGSTVANQLLWLFGLGENLAGFAVRSELDGEQDRLGYAEQVILASLGVDVEVDPHTEAFLDQMVARFGDAFPTTRVFSAFARETLPEVDAIADPDAALVAWINREEELFRTLERHLVSERLHQGFADDVDAFIAYSLSVHNRRKSRAGRALENHVEHILNGYGIVYERNGLTERQSRPDFLFPGSLAYQDPQTNPDLLTVLGAKSTCKDRWRQVLAEADRIPTKHLLTLEPGISVNQTDEMAAQRLQLVLPSALHDTYQPSQRQGLFNVADFLWLAASRQPDQTA